MGYISEIPQLLTFCPFKKKKMQEERCKKVLKSIKYHFVRTSYLKGLVACSEGILISASTHICVIIQTTRLPVLRMRMETK